MTPHKALFYGALKIVSKLLIFDTAHKNPSAYLGGGILYIDLVF